MNLEEVNKNAICDFFMKICSLERYLEIKRQILSDKSDFEPYLAYRRMARHQVQGITASNIHKFLTDNCIDTSLKKCQALVTHYDSDCDGILSYKEFLEMVLPKEHPDLRAFVTQRECFDISEEEFLSYETEVGLAVLIEKEIKIFKECYDEKIELTKLELDAGKIIEIIDEDKEGNLNFKNLRNFFHDSGLLPYDAEIISLLRRIDRDDDGIILQEELEKFLKLFFDPETKRDYDDMKMNKAIKQMDVRRESPGRKIVQNRITLLSSERKIVKGPSSTSKPQRVIEDGADPRKSLLRERAEVKQKMRQLEQEALPQKSLHRGHHNDSKSGISVQSNLQSRNSTINLKQYSQDQESDKSQTKLQRTIPNNAREKSSKLWENQSGNSLEFRTTDLKKRLNFEKSEKSHSRLPTSSYTKDKVSSQVTVEVEPNLQDKSVSMAEKPGDNMRYSTSKVENPSKSDANAIRQSYIKNSSLENPKNETSKAAHISSPSSITQESTQANHKVSVTTEFAAKTVPLRNSKIIRQSYDQPIQSHLQNSHTKAPQIVRVPQRSIDKRSPEKASSHSQLPLVQMTGEKAGVRSRDQSNIARSSSTKDIQETIKTMQNESSKSNLALERSRERLKYNKSQPAIVDKEMYIEEHKTPSRSNLSKPETSHTVNYEPRSQVKVIQSHEVGNLQQRLILEGGSPESRMMKSQVRGGTFEKGMFKADVEDLEPRIVTLRSPHRSNSKIKITASPINSSQQMKAQPSVHSHKTKVTTTHLVDGQQKIEITHTEEHADLKESQYKLKNLVSNSQTGYPKIPSRLSAKDTAATSQQMESKQKDALLKSQIEEQGNQKVSLITQAVEETDRSKTPSRHSNPNSKINVSQVSKVPDRHGRSPINFNNSSIHQSISIQQPSIVNKTHIEKRHDSKLNELASQSSMEKSRQIDPEDMFFNALNLILNQEKKLENSRRDLVSREDFIIKDVFDMIDKKGRGWFTIEDFRQFLNLIGVEDIDTRALIDLYSSFDSNQNCLLNFHELINMVCPQNAKYAQCINRKKENNIEMSKKTIEKMAAMFQRLFTLRRSIFDAKKLIRQENIDLHQIFEELDRSNTGTITKDDLGAFLKTINRDYEEDSPEVEALTNRMDIDKDGKINFKDFYMFFTL